MALFSSSFCFWKLELVLNLNFAQKPWENGVSYGRFGLYWRFMVLPFSSSLKDFFLLVQSFLISVTAPMFLNLPVSLPIHFFTPILQFRLPLMQPILAVAGPTPPLIASSSSFLMLYGYFPSFPTCFSSFIIVVVIIIRWLLSDSLIFVCFVFYLFVYQVWFCCS